MRHLFSCSSERVADAFAVRVRRVIIDTFFNLMPEMPDETLNGPRSRVAERADRVSFDLRGNFEQHVDFALLRAPFGHAVEHAPHPARAFTAGRTLAAALVLVEI